MIYTLIYLHNYINYPMQDQPPSKEIHSIEENQQIITFEKLEWVNVSFSHKKYN